MKYWRGYLTAAILLVCTWGLREFAKAHTLLVDMVYPYVTRMTQLFLVDWSSGVDYCLWQALVLVLGVLALVTVVLMVILKWNPIQWFGWICATVAAVVFLTMGVFGLNEFSGPLSEDIRLTETDYTITELADAATYYRDKANALADTVSRNDYGDAAYAEFETLANLASDGFDKLVYEQSLSVFAGPAEPVKKLGWAEFFSGQGIVGMTVALTGEAAVNPQTPPVILPFAMCREMARRMSISIPKDASFASYLACTENEDIQFQYSGALMAYRYCIKALQELDTVTQADTAAQIAAKEGRNLKRDLALCDVFFRSKDMEDANTCDLLVSWHIQEVVLPSLIEEEDVFDPMDKTQVDLSDNPNA